MTKQRTRNYATDKRKREVDVTGKLNLKDARKSNYNRVVHKPNPLPDKENF